jgi:hypothetical protein
MGWSRWSALVTALVAACIASGCGRQPDVLTQPPPPGASTSTAASASPSPTGPNDVALSAARDRWQRTRATNYQYELTVSCFCAHRGTYRLTVRNDRVVRVQPRDALPPGPRTLGESVDGLFARVAAALGHESPESRADRVIVSYDPAYGYPVRIDIDWDKDAVDDEASYRATSYVPLQ